jgi:hypothetical protein
MKFPVWRRRREEELEEEIPSHLQMAMLDRIERCEPAVKARNSACREFGNIGLVKEVTRLAHRSDLSPPVGIAAYMLDSWRPLRLSGDLKKHTAKTQRPPRSLVTDSPSL